MKHIILKINIFCEDTLLTIGHSFLSISNVVFSGNPVIMNPFKIKSHWIDHLLRIEINDYEIIFSTDIIIN